MAVDKVKPLAMESGSLGGTEEVPFPREIDPAEDYLASKGLAFENSDDYLAEKIGEVLKFTCPDASQKVTYSGDDVSYIEFFKGATQTTPNRRARVDVTYTGNDVTSEAWKIYDPNDGTTVLRTITLTHTYSASVYQSSSEVTT